MPSIHERVMDAAAALVVAEGLPGITASRVYTRLTADKAKVTLPCVVVNLEGCRETLAPLDTEFDQRTLPVNVVLLHRADLRSDAETLTRWLSWRESLSDAYLMQIFDDVTEVWHVDVEPLDAVDSQRLVGPEYQGGASGMILKALARTARRRPNG